MVRLSNDRVSGHVPKCPQTDVHAHKRSHHSHYAHACVPSLKHAACTHSLVVHSLTHARANSFTNVTIVFGIVGSGPSHAFDGNKSSFMLPCFGHDPGPTVTSMASQAGRKPDGKARQGDDEPMEAMPEQSQHGVRAAQSGPACGP